MTPAQALVKLTTDPDNFMRFYPVQIAGYAGAHTPGDATQVTMYLNKRDPGQAGDGPDKKEGHMGATRPRFLGLRNQQISSWKFDTGPSAGAHPVTALSVPMVNYNSNTGHRVNLHGQVHTLGKYVLDNSSNVMVTGQLSGCCFTWVPQGANLYCTHIQPIDGITGAQLQNAVNANGHFIGIAGTVSTFGRNDYPGYATVIGVRSGAGWRLYAQTSNDHGRTITGSYRIHPGPMTPL